MLYMELSSVKFVSEKREKDLNKMGVTCAEELLKRFPRDYVDVRNVTPLQNAAHNELILTVGEVLNVEVNKFSRRPFVKALCGQGDTMFTITWFNQPYVAAKLKRGSYLFYGRVQNKYGMGASLVNPTFEAAEKGSRLMGIIPVYSLSGSLTQGAMRQMIREALKKVEIKTVIPPALCRKYRLFDLKKAYELIHNPQTLEDVTAASERIALEEYFLLIIAFKFIKGDRDDARLRHYSVTKQDISDFLGRFPFEFTKGQKDAVEAIYDNLKSPHKMNRLLQGDVGCGKTAVALVGIYMAVKSGFQAAMVAPTEVLARQSAALVERYFPDYKVRALTGSTGAAEKREIKKGLASGEVDIVCGTHAILQSDVVFKNLAFAVCDEQQRFGVAQRASLSAKGDGCDVLIMSATPIPRTLSLIFYGDLDITTIREKPANRQLVSTSIIPAHKYGKMLEYVADQAARGFRTYFVCPKIEGDDEGTAMSVTDLYNELSAKLPTVRLALLHGKMKEKEKNDIMAAFKAGEYDALVATTVIEVGVDVPEATTMIIYNAERFGLSQLHQLRGRVGRGEEKSYCFLLIGEETEEARERLAALKHSGDGFEIAEADLKIRGGGDFMGTRQSGKAVTDIKNLRFPVSVIFTAKSIADDAFDSALTNAEDIRALGKIAAWKYESLKDIILN